MNYQNSLESLFHSLDLVSIRFERALRTKNSRDHMQVHLIPIPNNIIKNAKCVTVFNEKTNYLQLKFHEMQVIRNNSNTFNYLKPSSLLYIFVYYYLIRDD